MSLWLSTSNTRRDANRLSQSNPPGDLKGSTSNNTTELGNEEPTVLNTLLEKGRMRIPKAMKFHSQEQLQKANAKYDQLYMEKDELQKRLDKAENKGDKLERKTDEMQRHLDNKELFLGPQIFDDKIAERFESLLGRIRTWSLKYTHDASTSSGDLPLGDYEEYRQINSLCSEYRQVNSLCSESGGLHAVLIDQKKRRLFARGLVACVITNSIFRTYYTHEHPNSGGQDYWLDEQTRENFSNMENKLYSADRAVVSYREFNDWRALTAELLWRTRKERELPADLDTYLQSRVELIEKAMAPWVPPNPGNTVDGFEKLSDIFKEAIWLSQILRRQRPCWVVRFPIMPHTTPEYRAKHGAILTHEYDPRTMKDRQFDDFQGNYDDLRKKLVEFVVSPALYKRGTLGGDHFERESIVKKAEVVVYS